MLKKHPKWYTLATTMADITQTTLSILASATVALIVATAGFFYYQYDQTNAELMEIKNDVLTDETSSILEKVALLIELPSNETPTISTITNVGNQISDSLLKDTKKGDKVISYNVADRTIIYRPSTNKIIDVYNATRTELIESTDNANVAGTNTKLADEYSSSLTKASLTITISNGTKTVGLASEVASNLKDVIADKYEISQIVTKDANFLYPETQIIPISEHGKKEIAELVNITGFIKATLPQAESSPETDILIIAGNDIAEPNSNEISP